MNLNKKIDFSLFEEARQTIIVLLQEWQQRVDQVEIAVRETQQFASAIQLNNQLRQDIQGYYQQNRIIQATLPAANRRLQQRFLAVLMTLVNQLRSVPSHADVYNDLIAFKDRVIEAIAYIQTGNRG